MGTKNQAMRAKKQQRRKNKARSSDNNVSNKGYGASGKVPLMNRSIYDIIYNARELERRSRKGLGTANFLDRMELIAGLQITTTQSIKVHSAIVVYLKLVAEGKFVLTPEREELIEKYERALVQFREDLDAWQLLDQAGKKPEDYTELVLHMADLMNELTVFMNPIFLKEFKEEEQEFNKWVSEHLPTGMDLFKYMDELHEDRMREVSPKYKTPDFNAASTVEMIGLADENLSPLDQPLDDLIASNNIDPLPADHGEENGPLLTEIPQDPIVDDRKEDSAQ